MKKYAKITNIKKAFNTTLCDVICPECDSKMRISHVGWSAIVCLGCKTELYKKTNKA
jgi:ribosomal protein S27E